MHSVHTMHSAANGILTARLRHTVNAIARDQSHTVHSVHSVHSAANDILTASLRHSVNARDQSRTVHPAANGILTARLRHTVNAIARDQSHTVHSEHSVHSAANDIMPHFIILARFSTSSCGFATCFRHAFDFFCRKPGREPAASISTCHTRAVLTRF